jgi:hypothetical protein
LAEQTENPGNAYWTKNLSTVSGQKLIPNNGSTLASPNNGSISRAFTGISAQRYSASVRAKAAEFNRLRFRFSDLTTFAQVNSTVSLVDGAVVGSPVTSAQWTSVGLTVADDGDGWFRVSITGVNTATNNLQLELFTADSTATTGDGTSGILIDRIQFEAGVGTAYQRVTTAFDVTESGQRDCYGVRADGIDDGYLSPSITWGNQITVFVALRKASDADRGLVFENVDGGVTATGVFNFNAPLAASPTVAFRSSGSSTATAEATLAAPVTFVSSAVGNIATDTCLLRINGVQVATSVADQGTGNYAAGALRLFRRDGNVIPFNGNLYALIVAGGSYPSSTIQRVERLLSRITPTVNL